MAGTAERVDVAGVPVALRRWVLHDRSARRVAIGVGAALLAVALGYLSLRLQRHYAALEAAGDDLNPLTRLLADGSSWRTAWAGWAASLPFLAALARLRFGRPDPPGGRGGGDAPSVAEMRAALRGEYRAVRVALAAVAALAGFDLGRTAVYLGSGLRGDAVARGSMWSTAVEAAGLLAAAAVLWWWTRVFRGQLERWGAL